MWCGHWKNAWSTSTLRLSLYEEVELVTRTNRLEKLPTALRIGSTNEIFFCILEATKNIRL
jgi:hypothetical protein